MLGSFTADRNEALFLESTNCLRTNLELHFFAVDKNSFLLQVWLPHFLGVALRKANAVAELLAFTGDFTLTHLYSFFQWFILSVFTP